jgi:hypothetical protein
LLESMATSVNWVQIAVSVVCIAFGLTSAAPGNRMLAPLGVVLLAVAVFKLSADSQAAVPVGIAALLAGGFGAVWLFRLTRALRAGVSHAGLRPGRRAVATRLLLAVLAADLLVVGVFWTLTGQLAAAILTLSLVAIVAVAMLAALNRTNETRST